MRPLRYALTCCGLLAGCLWPSSTDRQLYAQAPAEPAPLRVSADARALDAESSQAGETAERYRGASPAANVGHGEQPTSYTPAPRHPSISWPETSLPATGLPTKAIAFDSPSDERQSGAQRVQKSYEAGTLSLRRSPGESQEAKPRGVTGLGTMFASLFLVLGLFFLAAWMLKRGMPRGSTLLPSEVVEVLGRAPLTGKQQLHLLRVGNKMLLVAISAGGVETLTEITDPLEVDRLAGLCQQQHPHSSTSAFKQIFQQFGKRAEPESLDEESISDRSPARPREARHV